MPTTGLREPGRGDAMRAAPASRHIGCSGSSPSQLLTDPLNILEDNPMNTKYLALILLAAGGAAVSATSASASTSPRVVDTWDGTNAYALNKTYAPVYATSLTSASYTKKPGSIMTDTDGFQCVELALRYFNYRKHIPVASWGGIGVATDMCKRQAPGVARTSHPVPGDLVVLRANDHDPRIATGPSGHVALVTGVSGDTISTFNQNWASDRTARATVSQSRDVLCSLHAGR
jgi:CHAP domain-containing protein